MFRIDPRRLWALPLVLLLIAGCGGEEAARDPVFIPDVSPAAIVELPEGFEVATIDIAAGQFGVAEVVLQEAEPSVLHAVNADDQSYRFRIEDLVTTTAIAPEATTKIMLTTPNAAIYEGQLLDAAADDVLETLEVVVIGPGAVQP